MSIGFILGNGISRRDIPFSNLKLKGMIYGCNAIYREYTPDVLVATDPGIGEYIQNSGYSKKHRFYTRKPIIGLGAQKTPHYSYSSGPNAIQVAIDDGCYLLYLVGFDMAPTTDNKFNNIYAGTEFYKPVDSIPTYSGNWISQIHSIASSNQKIGFIRVLGETSLRNSSLDLLKNYRTMELGKFMNMINT